MKMQVRRLLISAKLPSYAHTGDAGMDLYCAEEASIEPGGRIQVRTGVAVGIPSGYVGLIWDKSGLSHKGGLKVLGGVIDSEYRGEVLVGLTNLGREPYRFNVGDKVAQMLIQKVEHAALEEVSAFEETERGENGFGSTGA